MFGNAKQSASLSSSLLARKGHAKPAMRPQGFVGLSPVQAQDDLGWNDMGEDAAPQPEAPKPPVLVQREALGETLAQPAPAPEPVPEPAPLPVAPAAAKRIAREAVAKKTKAAFTLRLDTDRHLRLRLAAAVTHRSAQQLVTEALDAFLASLPEVEALARQIGPADKKA